MSSASLALSINDSSIHEVGSLCNQTSSRKVSRRISCVSNLILTDATSELLGKFSNKRVYLCGHRYEYDENEKNLLGFGSYGTVFAGRDLCHNQIVGRKSSTSVASLTSASKSNEKDAKCSYNTNGFVAIKKVMRVNIKPNELKAMKRVRHPNLVRLIDICNVADECSAELRDNDNDSKKEICLKEDDLCPFTYLIMERCDNDLDKHLKCYVNNERLDFTDLRTVIESIACGYLALYQKKIVHRDIKPQNILLIYNNGSTEDVDNNKSRRSILTAKITDFGISRILANNASISFDNEDEDGECGSNSSTVTSVNQLCNVAGTLYYMAPEVGANLLTTSEYDSSADIWSIGCVIYQCLVGKIPFDENMLCRLFLYCAGANYDAYDVPELPDDICTSDNIRALIVSLLQIDRQKRATPEQLYHQVMVNMKGFDENSSMQKQQLPPNLSSASLCSVISSTSTLDGGSSSLASVTTTTDSCSSTDREVDDANHQN